MPNAVPSPFYIVHIVKDLFHVQMTAEMKMLTALMSHGSPGSCPVPRSFSVKAKSLSGHNRATFKSRLRFFPWRACL